MTFDHIISTAVAMACHACGKYASNGMHQGQDGYWRHPECCERCQPAEPLEPGQAKAAGQQGELWGGDSQ